MVHLDVSLVNDYVICNLIGYLMCQFLKIKWWYFFNGPVLKISPVCPSPTRKKHIFIVFLFFCRYAKDSYYQRWDTRVNLCSVLCFRKMTPMKITPVSKRGKHEPKHKLVQETVSYIKKHIEQYNPAVSHYRHACAPLHRYLLPVITIREMYNDFDENGSGLIHYSTYQKLVQSMNISFAKLGEEECKTKRLDRYMEKLKEKDLQPPIATCTKCKGWAEHIISAGVAWKLYKTRRQEKTSRKRWTNICCRIREGNNVAGDARYQNRSVYKTHHFVQRDICSCWRTR